MRCRFPVTRPDGPSVLVEPDITLAHSNHRLDGDAHRGFQHDTIASTTVVRHLRVFVHLVTNTMARELANNTISMRLAVTLDSIADISQMPASHSTLNAFIERLLRCPEQLLDLVAHLTHTECVARVTAEAIQQGAAVDGDNIPFLEHRIRVGYAMYHNVIHRGADAGGKRPSIWIGETLESRDCSIVANELVGNLIQLEGRYARLDMFCQFAKGLTNKLVGLAHQLNFVFSLQKDFHAMRLVGTHATTVDTAGVEQTIIVTHEQVALNLLERVEHDTHENQQ